MKAHKTLFVILLILMSGSISVSSITASSQSVKPNAAKLVVATRHDFALRTTVAQAFADSELGASVGITSPSDIQFLTPTNFDGFVNVMSNPVVPMDVAWGGGPTLFDNLAKQGLLGVISDPAILGEVNTNTSDFLAGANMKKYDSSSNLIWTASALSSFGFTVNKLELQERGLTKPTKWEDLASPDFYTSISEFNLGMGNAPDTSSNTAIYDIILQKYGWEKGWELIYNMAGNAKLYTSSGETRDSILGAGGSDPDTAVSLTIDFYGYRVMAENSNAEYIVPENGSIVNADPIAFHSDPSHPAAARAFVEFVISQDGQASLFAENRLPFRYDAFKTPAGLLIPEFEEVFNATVNVDIIPYDYDLATTLEVAMQSHFSATIYNVRDKLRTAWGTLVNAFKQNSFPKERFDQINAEFGKPLITLAEAQALETQFNDDAFRTSKQAEWTAAANDKFDKVIDMVDDPFTLTTTEVITSGNETITSTFEETTTASSVSDTVDDVPVEFLPQLFAIFTLMTIKLVRKRKN